MSSIYLFGNGEKTLAKPAKVLELALPEFTEEQASSLCDLLRAIAKIDAANADAKQDYLAKITAVFDAKFNKTGKW